MNTENITQIEECLKNIQMERKQLRTILIKIYQELVSCSFLAAYSVVEGHFKDKVYNEQNIYKFFTTLLRDTFETELQITNIWKAAFEDEINTRKELDNFYNQ